MSNKTPKEPANAIESAPRKRYPLFGFLAIAIGLFLLFSGVRSLLDDRQPLVTPKGTIQVFVADDASERSQGLSGYVNLQKTDGMLFVFDVPSDQHCFWMKDMNFAVDMIWLDSSKKIIYSLEDVKPDSYPQSFCPPSDALYVLEVGVGQAQELGLVKDVTVRF